MNLPLVETLQLRTVTFVSEALAKYEMEDGVSLTSTQRDSLERFLNEIVILVFEKVKTTNVVSVDSLNPKILEGAILIGIGNSFPTSIYTYIIEDVSKYILAQAGNNYDLVILVENYFSALIKNSKDSGIFASSSVFDILRTPEQYQYSESLAFIDTSVVDKDNRRAYTLFDKIRYWEEYQNSSTNISYSPLYYNRVASSLGKESQIVPIDYSPVTIKDNRVYKLNPGVRIPSKNGFDLSEWTQYASKRLDSQKKFTRSLSSSVNKYYEEFLRSSSDINNIISDSEVKEYLGEQTLDEDMLVSTFGGEGKSIYQTIQRLKSISDYFGSYEGSIVGSIDYISQYSEYLLSSTYGRNITGKYEIIGNTDSFGKFDLLFASGTYDNKIPGLSFLNKFTQLKSFIHNERVADSVDVVFESTSSYNPIYEKYKLGLNDRYKIEDLLNSYKTEPEVDLLLYAIETLYKKTLYLGDMLDAMTKSLDGNGRLPGYEGLGSIQVQLGELQRVFPPSTYIDGSEDEVLPGLSGGIKKFLRQYSTLYTVFGISKLQSDSVGEIKSLLVYINQEIEQLIYAINKLSVDSFSFIPDISNKKYVPNIQSSITLLSDLGFRDSEIEKLTKVDSFQQLIQFFAPISDSNDLKSFFKGLELSQLIYELGGEDGINAYLSFLYSKSDIENLLNILNISQVDLSTATSVQTSKYPRLIGLLIGLTQAVDPNQLVKFNEILTGNNLKLLEAISYLIQSGQKNILRSKEEIEVIQPIIDQAIQGFYSDSYLSPDLTYPQVNSVAPIALRQWTKLIEKNLGYITSKTVVKHLYDRLVGLTPKELLTILNAVSPFTQLGQMLDGLNGGEFTRLIKYANITGLGVKLGYFKNSVQRNNFQTDKTKLLNINSLLDQLESMYETIDIINNLIEKNIDYVNQDFASESTLSKVLFNAQNKSFDTLNQTIFKTLNSTDTQNFIEISKFAGNSTVQESPGIGNSRIPNRIPVLNSITPEQYKLLFSNNKGEVVQQIKILASSMPGGLINNFFKFAEQNKLINTINTVDEKGHVISRQNYVPETINPPVTELDNMSSQSTSTWMQITPYDTQPTYVVPSELTYNPPEIYKIPDMSPQIKSKVLGVSYVDKYNKTYLPANATEFNPQESCEKFGGENCESLYENSAEKCVDYLNKSLYPEEYTFIPGTSPGSIAIDRPLGSFVDYKPQNIIVPTSSYSSPPAYSTLFGPLLVGFGENGEPFTSEIQTSPIVFSSGGGEVSEYNNTEFGTTEAIKAKLEKQSEFNCASFKSPYDYQVCMNILKCKKYDISKGGGYSMKFCPKTTAGGRKK